MKRYSPEIKTTYERWGDMEAEHHAIMIDNKDGRFVSITDVIKELEVIQCGFSQDESFYLYINSIIRSLS